MDLSTKILIFIGLCGITLTNCGDGTDSQRVGTDMIDIPASAEDPDRREGDAVIYFEQRESLAGEMVQGEVRRFEYSFKNTGKGPLVISSVTGSCGCTVPLTYPRGAIAPGEGGIIEVEFDSAGKSGDQTMTISVVSNSVPNLTQLIIRANILVPDNMKNK